MCIELESKPLSGFIMPGKISPFYHQLIRSSDYYHELRCIIESSQEELGASGKLDTSGENTSTVMPGLQQKEDSAIHVMLSEDCNDR